MTDEPEAPSEMWVDVTTYGGEERWGGFHTVQHWQLHVNDHWIADTSDSSVAALFCKIAERCQVSAPGVRREAVQTLDLQSRR